MITKRYVTIFLVGSCLILDHSSQIPLQTSLHSRTSRGVICGGGRKNLGLGPSLGEVPSVEGKRRWRRQGRSGTHRIKRGWVWNQFFVLEEYMGSEPQYVGKLHTEMDQGDNAVKYTLSGEGVGSVFTIDQVTGDIHAQVVLDREKKSYYTLKAQAVDVHTGIPLEPESEFIIKVQDINDNEPQFPDGPYSASVPEMSPAGTYVTQVTATDADDPTYGNSARIVYSILHGQPYFSVDPKTGIIRTALANMDREVKEEYQVLLQAKDMGGQLGGLASTTIINITLTDVNDNPPRFTKSIFHLHVPESASLGAAVGRIQAQDLDVGSNARVDFAIVPGDEGNMFDIISNGQSQEGIVVLKKTLDYETQASYTFKVEAFNAELDPRFLHLGPFKDSVTVKINVLDVDEPPVFTTPYYSLDVYEDTPPGTIIGSVTAYDLDASSSAVRYSLEWQTGSDSFFDIETVEGTLSTNEYLDRETAVQHNITVVATKLSHNQVGVMASSVNTSLERSTGMRTRAKRGNNNVDKMDVRVTSGVTVAPPAQLADRRKSQELEICKMSLEWQKDKIDELTKERDYLKEQLAASLSKEPTSSVQDSSEVLSISSPSSDGSFDESSNSSMSITSSDEDRKKRKKKGKAKKHKKSKKHYQKQRTRVQNPKQVVTRYNKILRLFKRGGTMSAAFKRLGVDRNTIVATAPIAELFIVAPERYKELEKNKQGQKLSLFATQCAAAISADPETEEKFKAYKSSGKLLPLKTKKD